MRRIAPLLVVLSCGCEEIGPAEYPSAAAPADEEVAVAGDDYADTDPSALAEFRGALDAHGAWVEDDVYGTVWVPDADEVGPDFTPYVTAGHWTWDDEWVWVSDWEWGWAPFHYGRWVFVDGRGWAWIPGRRYAGAWVVWQSDGAGYLAWAAMPPWWIWRGGFAVRVGFGVGLRYVYCPREHVFEPGLRGRVFWGERAAGVSVGMRTIARPTPQAMGIGGAPPRPAGDAGFARARQYSRPSTAAAVGAHPPTNHVVRASPAVRGTPPPMGRGISRPGGRPGGRGGGGHGGHR